MRNRTIPVLILASCTSACGNGGDNAWGGTVDTLESGTVVVHNLTRGLWTPASAWRLEPVVRIGALDGEEPYVFGWVADVELGPDSAVYVLDRQAAEVRVFDLGGRHLRTFGGPGAGPGELERPYAMTFDDEGRLWVGDSRNLRYTGYTSAGDPVATYRSPIRAPWQGRLRFDGRGNLLERDWWAMRLLVFGEGPAGVVADTIGFPLWRPEGFTRSLGTEVLTEAPPLAPRPEFELSASGRVWTGVGDRYAIHAVSFDGDTVLTITRDVAATPLSDRDRAALDAWIVDTRRKGFDGDESDLPDTYPYFDRIVEAEDGHLWVYREAAGQGSFDVFDPDGLYLGNLPTDLAAGNTGTHPYITADYLVGVVTDALDVPYVQVHRIVRDGTY